jgi:diamine N-acetyltransferase
MVNPMLESSRVLLRPWEESDLIMLCELRNDVAMQAQLMARPRGATMKQVRQWLTSFETDPQSLLLVLVELSSLQSAGFIQVKNLDPINLRAEIGIGLGTRYQGKGLGSDAIALLGSYLKKNWNLRKLLLQVRSDNSQAIAAYEKCGFCMCGLYQKHLYIEGAWHDVTLMELFLQESL